MEKVVDYFGSYAYEYDLLEVSISLVPFIKEGVIRRGVVIEDPHKFIPHQIILKPEYFLDDYVSITFKISVYKEPHFGEYMKEDNDFLEKSQVFSPSSEFIVKYNEFINLINELGYELVQYPNFERVRDAMKCRPSSEIKSIIEIDFRLKNNRKAKVKR